MKKVILFGIVAIMIASLLLASGPPLRIVRLTVINKSGNDVFLKLEGSDLGNQFYYLTIPGGTKSMPVVRAFTIIEDIYTRTTTYGEGKYDQCVGVSSSGQLVAHKNIRLTFVPCAYNPPTRRVAYWDEDLGDWTFVKEPNYGEPTMEKVLYARWLELDYIAGGAGFDEEYLTFDSWDDERLNILWKRGCGFDTYLYWAIGSVRWPKRGLCRWTYTYDKTHEN